MRIKGFLNESLEWFLEEGSVREYLTPAYPKYLCHLRMNNFPDEPLWTLTLGEESLDFDNTPTGWIIHYPQ